jgi:antitoxin component YwqK of YwqJK toxin-antitoxin module
MKKASFIVLIHMLCGYGFAQDFFYSFENPEIRTYLKKNRTEEAFNSLICMDSFEEFSCVDNFDDIRYEQYSKKYYYRSGKAVFDEEYNDDIRVVKSNYFNTDTIFSITEHKGDLLWNIKIFNKKGGMYDTGNFKDGNGKLKYYRQNGSLSAIENFSNGKLNGKVVLYYSNGSIMLKGQFKDGVETGKWEEFLIKNK